MGKTMRFNAKFQKDAKKPRNKKNTHLGKAGRESVHESKKSKLRIKGHGQNRVWPLVDEANSGRQKI
ncbi:MAG: hypothetical protein ABH827_03685 [bacterium]